MKLKLIRTPGFTGKPKIAEIELAEQSDDLKQYLQEVFAKPADIGFESLNFRDKESMLLEFDGKMLPLGSIELNEQLDELIQRMIPELKYRK